MNDRKKQVMSFVRKRLSTGKRNLIRIWFVLIWQICAVGLAKSRESYLSSGSFCFGIFQRSL